MGRYINYASKAATLDDVDVKDVDVVVRVLYASRETDNALATHDYSRLVNTYLCPGAVLGQTQVQL